jgi:hypothetical protein
MFNFFKRKKMHYVARFVFDVDVNYPQVFAKFMFRNVHVNFIEKISPPNQAEIVLGPLEEETIRVWQETFRGCGCPFKLYTAPWDKVKDTNYFL